MSRNIDETFGTPHPRRERRFPIGLQGEFLLSAAECFRTCDCATLTVAYSFGGTYSLGLAEPSPKKNCSSWRTMTS